MWLKGQIKMNNARKYDIIVIGENVRVIYICLYRPAHQARMFSPNITANWWAGLFKVMK
jgi:L-rhamnose mutarotase